MAMTAKDLVARGSEILNRKKECINIEIDGVGVWRLRVPTPAEWNDNNVYFDAHENEARNVDVVHVFRQCEEPNLKDAELCKYLADATERKDATPGPWVVDAILKPGEVTGIVEIMLKQLGYLGESAHIVSDEDSRAVGEGLQAKNAYALGEEVKNG